MKRLILGDAHGQFHILKKLIQQRLPDRRVNFDDVFILGDMGIGFGIRNEELPPFMSDKDIYFIRGNHDNPDEITNLARFWKTGNWNYIPDGHIEDGVLYIGGAWSIDWKMRTPGRDWWFNEELNEEQMGQIEDAILNYDDEIHTVMSHDCPYSIYPQIGVYNPNPSKTSHFLEELKEHFLIGPKRPTQWFFGHHHKKFDARVGSIRFRCIAPIDSMDYEVIDI